MPGSPLTIGSTFIASGISGGGGGASARLDERKLVPIFL